MFLKNFPSTFIALIHDSDKTKPVITKTTLKASDIPDGYGAFFTVNGFRGTRKKENLTHVSGVFADIDQKGGKMSLQDIQQMVFVDLPPTFINETKNGWHLIWLLTEPIVEITQELVKTIEGINRRFVEVYGADNAAIDIGHLLRIPGTEHRKNPAEPFRIATVYQSDDTYTLDELIAEYPPIIKEDMAVEYGTLGDDVQSRLNRMLQKPNIAALWSGDDTNQGESESDMALCCHLAFWLAKDPNAMEQAWLQSPRGQREKVQKRADYRKLTIDKAISLTSEVYTPKTTCSITCPERDSYFEHFAQKKWGDNEWEKKLKKLGEKYIANFYKYLASKYPHLLFEVGEDKSYWNYNTESGVYDSLNFSTVRGLVAQLMIDDGFETVVTETTVKNILLKYRAVYTEKGVSLDSFVSHEDYFHVANGWLNTRTRVLTPHTPNRLSLYKSKVCYNPNATGQIYNKMLDEQYQLPKDAVRVIDQFSGYILTHNVDQQKMLVFEGRPGCGKSTLPRIWLELLGEKATTASLASLSNSEVRFMGGNFVNKNFCFFDEANPKTENINEYFMSMADQKTIRVERKGIQGVNTPRYTMKVVLSLNKMPYHQPEGFKRRYRHILFERSFTDEGIEDTQLLDKVTTSDDEMSAVLNRMLDGLDDLRKMGKFTMISGEEDRKREHTIAADTMSEFLDTYFEPVYDDEVRFSFQELKEAYQELFPTSFNRQLSTAGFNKELLNPRLPEFKHIRKGKSKNRRGYTGFRLKQGYSLGVVQRGNDEKTTIRINVHELPDDSF